MDDKNTPNIMELAHEDLEVGSHDETVAGHTYYPFVLLSVFAG
jgi:hypothetical protein